LIGLGKNEKWQQDPAKDQQAGDGKELFHGLKC
jgi:hypothetical protein